VGKLDLSFIEADGSWKERVAAFSQWGENAARHLHTKDGFTILALQKKELAGVISVYWKELPAPLSESWEGYIDILEVHKDYRRKGIAGRLVQLCAERGRAHGAIQLRSWSSLDKQEAIPMWKALGFGLCPAVTYPAGKEVHGYFVTRRLEEDE
jgi:ribosomal protein S18 acetylase RimI-like enzyme